MRGAAITAGWSVYDATGWRLPEDLNLDEPVLYADILFADVAAGALNLALLEPSLDWVVSVPPAYLQRSATYSTLAEARRRTGPFFAKPADDKCFPAEVYDSGEDLPSDDLLPCDTQVILSEPVVWEVEYRLFVLNRAVRAISPYLRFGELAQDADGNWPVRPGEAEAAAAFADAVLADPGVAVPAAVVLDVGIITGRGWAVVEANAAWGSGIYGCDPGAVLPVLCRACVRRDQISEQDARWARPYRSVVG
jgi:hypothetical protein